MLRVMIVDNDLTRSKALGQLLISNGFDVIAQVEENVHLQTKCCELDPDIVIVETESLSRALLDTICMITQHNAKPVIILAQDGEREVIKAATEAGVSTYEVGTITSERLTQVIEAAVARFEKTKQLRDERQQANETLDERKVVERAKDILMRQRNLDEDEAYKMLRTMAMKRNIKIAELSNQLIDTAKMLTI